MHTCARCESFVPDALAACPACESPSPRRAGRVLRGVASLAGGSLFAMTLSACYGAPDPGPPFGYDGGSATDAGSTSDGGATCDAPASDTDGDGYCGSLDCDETNAAIHVGAFDTAGDMTDSDCGGTDAMD